MYYKVISHTVTNREFKSCMACQALHLIMHPKFFSQNAQHSENFTIMHNSTMLTHWYRKVYNYSIHQIQAQARITDPSFRVKDPKLQTAKKKKKKKEEAPWMDFNLINLTTLHFPSVQKLPLSINMNIKIPYMNFSSPNKRVIERPP